MSIRLLALELYRAQQKVHQLEERLAAAPPAAREALETELREAREELRMIRNMVEGAKTPLPFRTSHQAPKHRG